ncbi:MAG: hypothetical protein AAF441_27690 [Pseudomonadota bacterium]
MTHSAARPDYQHETQEGEATLYDGIAFDDYPGGGVHQASPLWTGTRGTGTVMPSQLPQPAASSDARTDGSLYLRSLIRQCERMTAQSVTDVSWPGGSGRDSFQARLANGSSVVVTRRETAERALLEERVLTHLGAAGAPVPEVIGFNGIVLVQSDAGGERLSNCLHASPGTAARDLPAAIESLLRIHQAGRDSGLAGVVPLLGADADWVRGLIDRPAVLGAYLDVTAPVPDLDGLFDLLMLTDPAFVKWDSRPGNCASRPDQDAVWFDWEHCGARNGLDDLVWLLCDEFMVDAPRLEAELIVEFAGHFSDEPAEVVRHYLAAAGVLHMCVRLSLILSEAENDGWGTTASCVRDDSVGSSPRLAARLCARAARWSDSAPQTAALAPWFERIGGEITRRAAPPDYAVARPQAPEPEFSLSGHFVAEASAGWRVSAA